LSDPVGVSRSLLLAARIGYAGFDWTIAGDR
jgi:hypothetical protein